MASMATNARSMGQTASAHVFGAPFTTYGEVMKILRVGLMVGALAATVVGVTQAIAGSGGPMEIIVMHKPAGQGMVCMAVGKQPCNAEQVNALASETKKRGVSVSLAGQDGALKCTTRDARDCTDQSVAVVQAAARAIQAK
jgi:hypothetical protein